MQKFIHDSRGKGGGYAYCYLAPAVDARIAELEKALRQIAIGADPGEAGDGLTYAEIQSIANSALAIKELP